MEVPRQISQTLPNPSSFCFILIRIIVFLIGICLRQRDLGAILDIRRSIRQAWSLI